MNATSIPQPKTFLADLPTQKAPLSLRCRACKAVGHYRVGRITVDPAFKKDVHGTSPQEVTANLAAVPWDKWIYFAGYFVCESCGSGGPWQLTPQGKKEMALLMLMHLMRPRESGIFLGTPMLFDGTAPRTGFDAVQHLKKLIEAQPDSAFLWSRLGNTFVTAEKFEESVPAFEKAVEIDPADVESLHSLANTWFNNKEFERAAIYYKKVLHHCKDGTWRREELKPVLVQEAIATLVTIHQRTCGKWGAPARPTTIGEIADRPDLATFNLRGLNLASEDGVDRLVRVFLHGPLASVLDAHMRWQGEGVNQRASRQRTGRNDPCPCGSGRKFKHCCLKN